MSSPQHIAVILAGGTGSRLGMNVPKAFVPLLGRSLIWHAVSGLVAASSPVRVIVAVPAGSIEAAQTALDGIVPQPEIVVGGPTRMSSLAKSVDACGVVEDAIVFVHDAARPVVSLDVASALLSCMDDPAVDAAIPVTMPTQTAKWLAPEGQEVVLTLERGRVALAETPQVIRLSRLCEGLVEAARCGFEAPDEASLIERIGGRVRVVDGGRGNLKVTWPEDVQAAETLMRLTEGGRHGG